MKIEGYEEISEEEHLKNSLGDNLYVYAWKTDTKHWFKKAQKFPIVLEDDQIEIKIDGDGFFMKDKFTKEGIYLWFNKNFSLLRAGVEKAEEIMKKKC